MRHYVKIKNARKSVLVLNDRGELIEYASGTPCINNDGSSNFNKCGVCIDRVRPLIRPTLENRIYSGLEEFICKPNSRYAKRFPCVKKCLDVIAAWIDYMDAFCAKGTDVTEQIIKYAIENLVKDGLVTHFVDSVLLNNRVNRVCQEIDSLGMEQAVLRNMNVWRFINEKDYWLSQNCQDSSGTSRELSSEINSHVHECTKGSKNSDVEVEIGSVARRVQHCTCEKSFACKSSSHRKINNTESLEVQTCREETEVTGKPRQKTLYFAKENADEFKVTRATMTSDCNYVSIGGKSCKLKVVVHKTTSTNCSTILNLAKVTSISVPCKPSHLIVRIFEADPSLSGPSLILMRSSIESGIYDACSCLNDILQKLDHATIRDSCLSCEIRPGHIDLNLRRRRTFKIRLFLARVPTCHSCCKRDKCTSYENATTEGGELQPLKNVDVPIDRCCKDMAKCNGEDEGPRVVFCAPCSNSSLLEETKGKTNKAVKPEEKLEGKVSKNELDFVWSRKVEKEVDFLLSPCSMRVQEAENSAVSCAGIQGDEKRIERSEEIDGNRVRLCVNEIKEENESRATEDRCQVETCENQSVAENSRNKRELCDSKCSCSSDSLEGGAPCECVSRESGSTTGNCNSNQCFCHIFFRSNTMHIDERGEDDVCANRPELDNFKDTNLVGATDCCYCPGEDALKVQAIPPQAVGGILKLEMNVQQMGNNVDRMKEINLEGKKHTLQPKDSALEAKAGHVELAGDAFQVKSGVCQVKGIILAGEESSPRTSMLETRKRISEMNEQYSEDSISVPNCNYPATDCGAKCSCDGMDPSNAAARNIEPESFSVCARPSGTYLNFEVLKTSSLNLAEANLRGFSRRSNVFTDRDGYSKKDLSPKSRGTAANPAPSYRWSTLQPKLRGEPKRLMNFTIPAPTYFTKNLCGGESVTEMQNKAKEENYFPIFSRCRNRFWRSSIIPSNFCGPSSAVSIDRIKHLIRKKLGRMLLKERNKGTNTSKTFLKNDRYLVSISSGKLNGKRIIREPIASSSDRCCVAAKCRVVKQGETVAERNFAIRKRGAFEESVKKRYRKLIQDTEVFKRIRAVNVSRILGQMRVVKSAGRHKTTNQKEEEGMKGKLEARNERRCSCNCGENSNKAASVASDGSAQILFTGGDTRKKEMAERYVNLDKIVYEGSRNLKEKKCLKRYHDVVDFHPKLSSRRSYHGKRCPGCEPSQISDDRTKNENDASCDVVPEDVKDELGSDKLRSFQKRSFNFEDDCDEDNDVDRLFSNYERHMNNLSADFRLKLLQYVALCRSVKDSLVTRLQSDDVHKVSLGSVYGRKSIPRMTHSNNPIAADDITR
ncbi:uncharacterized protein LOC143370056 [Andrena cerasifolii]|uniref:uncharacterized protein LOC143370056 n=1 Tax=Andrena cerasifolii TaxID=2819439 RepID=UPI004037B518